MRSTILLLFVSILSQYTMHAENATLCSMILEVREVVVMDPFCHDGLNGLIEVEADGGEEPYVFSLNGGLFTDNTVFDDLGPGSYTVIVKDDLGDEAEIVITLENPESLIISLVNSEDNICNGAFEGSIEVTASGGTIIDDYKYEINGGMVQDSGVFTNLASGFYVVSVFDDNQCIEQISLDISSPNMIQLVASNLLGVSCFGDEDGEATIVASGGVGEFLYAIDGLDFTDKNSFLELESGLHSVEVMDSNGCLEIISFTIDTPQPISFTSDVIDVVCKGDSSGVITIVPGGGTPPYLYSFEGEELDTMATFFDLIAGIYVIEVSDSLGCTFVEEVSIAEPDILLLISDTIVDASCLNDGYVVLDLLGAQGDVLYSIDGVMGLADTFYLPVGEYEATAQDSVGCSGLFNFEIIDLSDIEVSISEQVNVSCFDGNNGSVSILATGGEGNLTYSLDGESAITIGSFDSLDARNYIVIVSDSVGCTGSVLVMITEPDELVNEITELTNVTCFSEANGSVEGIISGGVFPFEFSSDQGVLTMDSSSFSIDELIAGDVFITIFDSNGCNMMDTFVISENLPIQLTIDSIAAVNCTEGVAGFLQMSAVGGAANYDYKIDSLYYNEGVFADLKSGLYTIDVTDSLGCQVSQEVNIGSNGGLIVEGTVVKDVSCFGAADGLFDVYIPNHLGNIEWTIDGVSNQDSSFLSLSAGLYSIFAIDDFDCNVSIDAEIIEPQELILDVLNYDGGDGTNGEIIVLASGGTEPYLYSIDDKMTFHDSGSFINLVESNYEIVVVDANGCEHAINHVLVDSDEVETMDLKINPNPVYEYLKIEGDFESNNFTFEIISLTGMKLKKGSISTSSQIDVKDLKNGIYLLIITDGLKYQVNKFVKQ